MRLVKPKKLQLVIQYTLSCERSIWWQTFRDTKVLTTFLVYLIITHRTAFIAINLNWGNFPWDCRIQTKIKTSFCVQNVHFVQIRSYYFITFSTNIYFPIQNIQYAQQRDMYNNNSRRRSYTQLQYVSRKSNNQRPVLLLLYCFALFLQIYALWLKGFF